MESFLRISYFSCNFFAMVLGTYFVWMMQRHLNIAIVFDVLKTIVRFQRRCYIGVADSAEKSADVEKDVVEVCSIVLLIHHVFFCRVSCLE